MRIFDVRSCLEHFSSNVAHIFQFSSGAQIFSFAQGGTAPPPVDTPLLRLESMLLAVDCRFKVCTMQHAADSKACCRLQSRLQTPKQAADSKACCRLQSRLQTPRHAADSQGRLQTPRQAADSKAGCRLQSRLQTPRQAADSKAGCRH